MDEDIMVTCDGCRKQIRSTRRNIGKKGRCPGCGSIIHIYEDADGTVKGLVERKVMLNEMQARQNAMLKVVKHDNVGVVSFRTSRILDQSNVMQLGVELEALLTQYKLTKIVVNFANVHYMSSAVMGKLVSLHKQVAAAGGELRLCCIADSIFEIFKIMRFDKLFRIRNTEDEAVIELIG
jgi:anti-sigma B factor antagonist